MKAHSRVAYLGVLIAVFLLACGFFVSRSILEGFSRIETQNVLSEVGWVMSNWEAECFEYGDFLNDIAALPETSAFFAAPSEAYVAEYFGPSMADVFVFDFVAMFDPDHDYVMGVRYDADLSNESGLFSEPSLVLSEWLAGQEVQRGLAVFDVVEIDSRMYLVSMHPVHDMEDSISESVGTLVLGRALPTYYDEFDGALGTTYSLVSRLQDSPWNGLGQPLRQEAVYPIFEEETLFEDEVPGGFEDVEDEALSEWETVEFDLDFGLFERTHYYRLPDQAMGPDGQPKIVVMCSLGGAAGETQAVMKVLVPQTISSVAAKKGRLVTAALGAGVFLTVGFTWLAVGEIRRRLKAEQMVRSSNRELESVNGQKDRLFSIIGHDMRAPLNGVIRLSELMARAPDSFSSTDVARFANNINQTGKQLHGLLENLLNWARLQTGQLPCHPTRLDLAAVIRQVDALYRPRAEETGIELDIDVSDGMTVKADVEMLKTILRNLMSNALKFTDAGGHVSVSVSELDGEMRISVSDTGIGMREEQLSVLFDLRASSVNRSGPEGEQGSGFGLLLCHEMVRRHDSDLEVFSDIGVGTEFSFTLPAA